MKVKLILSCLIALFAGTWFTNIGWADVSGQEAALVGWQHIRTGALLIDVRSADEFAEGHIDGALNIPYDQTDALVEAIGPDTGRDVVLYCRTGRRAGLSADALKQRGYTSVYNALGYEDLLATQP